MSPVKLLFNRQRRLTRKSQFDLMYKDGRRRISGPLLVHTRQNGLEFSRLGLSIPKRIGNAVTRNKIKRRCREAFRISQHELPDHIDILLTIRPHDPLATEEYAALILMGSSR
jgi:ribonuclease P protein component